LYQSLQAGRAVAALLVVIYHLGAALAAQKYFGVDAFAVPFPVGAFGVYFFFVLSGFIILTVHAEDVGRPARFAGYLKKRLIRIYPTYWLIFVPVLAAALAASSLRDAVPHDALVLFKAFLLIPQDPAVVGSNGSPVLVVAWTLQYEMLFYLFFGLLILSRALAAAAAIGLLLLVAFAGSHAFPWSFFAQDYLWLFAMGMAVAALCRSKKAFGMRMLLLAGASAVLLVAIGIDAFAAAGLFKDWRIVLYGLAGALIVFGAVSAEDRGRVIGGQRAMQTLGDASYALYLMHYPLISLLCKLAMLAGLDKLGLAGAAIAYAVILGACMLAAVAFHLWIEKPLTTYLRTR